MVNVGLVAVDGMKMGCRRLWLPIVAGSASTPGRLGRGRPVRCGRQRRRAVCATARPRGATARRRRFVAEKAESDAAGAQLAGELESEDS